MLIPPEGSDALLPTENPAELFVLCHGRIRRFAALAVQLATVGGSPAALAAGASALLHHFRTAVPLHVEDEEKSIVPRLLNVVPTEFTKTIELLLREHAELDLPISAAMQSWEALLQAPERRDVLRDRLLSTGTRLRDRLDAHFAQEEAIILPALEIYLDGETLREIAAEMHSRRE